MSASSSTVLQRAVGIDVAKAHLDVHLLPQQTARRFTNTAAGHTQLLRLITPASPERIVLESTGGYERSLLRRLQDAGLPAALVNPLRVRRFAQATGRLAKNDRIDARLLADFACRVDTRLATPVSKIADMLRELVVRRRQLVNQCVQLRNQREHARFKSVTASVDRSITHVREEVKAVERLIAEQIESDPSLRARRDALLQAVGVGPAVAAVLVSELPELGTLSRNPLAALVGLAPFDDDSGRHRGTRHIRGGRTGVRAALYMATLVGIRREAHLKAHYQQLIARGKPKKVALVACMHKRLNYLNSLLRNHKTD